MPFSKFVLSFHSAVAPVKSVPPFSCLNNLPKVAASSVPTPPMLPVPASVWIIPLAVRVLVLAVASSDFSDSTR